MTRPTLLSLAAASLVSALACSGGDQKHTSDSGAASAAPATGGGLDLTGAGATFPYPIYSKWISEYSAKTGIKINYQAIGSGGGIRQLSEGTVDFAGSDAPMTDDELAKAKGGPILHLPDQIHRQIDEGRATSSAVMLRAVVTSTPTMGPSCAARITSAGKFFITAPSTSTLGPSVAGGSTPGSAIEARSAWRSSPRRCSW